MYRCRVPAPGLVQHGHTGTRCRVRSFLRREQSAGPGCSCLARDHSRMILQGASEGDRLWMVGHQTVHRDCVGRMP